MRDAIAKFADQLLGQKAPAQTLRAYTTSLTQWLAWLAQETVESRVEQLTRWHMADYVASLAKRGLEASSIRRKLAAIRRSCTWSHEAGLIATNPMRGVRGPKLPHKEPLSLNAPEL